MEKNKGGRPTEKTGSTEEPVSKPPSVGDIGITKKQSSRFQQAASVPEEQFERHIDEKKAAGKPITSSGVAKLTTTKAAGNAPSGNASRFMKCAGCGQGCVRDDSGLCAGCEVNREKSTPTPAAAKPRPKLRPNTKEARKPRECVEILAVIDSIAEQITLLRQMLEATGGQFTTHRFDLPEQVKRLNFARSTISLVRASTKGE